MPNHHTRDIHPDQMASQLSYGNSEDASISGSSSNAIISSDQPIEIKLSRRRWLLLIAISLFGFTMSLVDGNSSILKLYLELLHLDIKQFSYLQPLFLYIMMISAFPTAIFVDKYGLKVSLRASAGLFLFHGLTRAMLFFPDAPYHESYRIPCYILSSILGVQMMALFMLLPLKVSETWFSSSERTVAWAFMFCQMNLGTCITSFLYPRIIRRVRDFAILGYICITSVSISVLSTFLLVTKSEPDYPPNERIVKANRETPKSLRESLMKLIKHKDMLIHLVHLAIFESAAICVQSVFQDVLISIGYSEIFVGNLLSANSLVSIIVQILLATLVNGQKNPTLICKVGSSIVGLLFVGKLLTITFQQSAWLIIGTAIVLTIFRAWMSSNMNNMTAHLACGTVSHATVVGVSMFLTVSAMTVVNPTFTTLIVISGKKVHNYTHSLSFLCALVLINEIIYLIFFGGQQAKTVQDGDIRDIDGQIRNLAIERSVDLGTDDS